MAKLNYFISIENTPYYHWQADLLIKSFKRLGIQDQLVISIADIDNPIQFGDYAKSLYSHKRIFRHKNMGKNNRLRALIAALENKTISQPFVLLHSDMILFDTVEFDCNFYFDTYSTKDEDKWNRVVAPHVDVSQMNYIPFGDIYGFSGVSMDFFYLWNQELRDKEDYYFNREKDALLLAVYKLLLGRVNCVGEVLQSELPNPDIKNVIHYKHGLPPEFNKYSFKDLGYGWAGGDPYEVLSSNKSTPAMSYICQLLDL